MAQETFNHINSQSQATLLHVVSRLTKTNGLQWFRCLSSASVSPHKTRHFCSDTRTPFTGSMSSSVPIQQRFSGNPAHFFYSNMLGFSLMFSRKKMVQQKSANKFKVMMNFACDRVEMSHIININSKFNSLYCVSHDSKEKHGHVQS